MLWVRVFMTKLKHKIHVITMYFEVSLACILTWLRILLKSSVPKPSNAWKQINSKCSQISCLIGICGVNPLFWNSPKLYHFFSWLDNFERRIFQLEKFIFDRVATLKFCYDFIRHKSLSNNSQYAFGTHITTKSHNMY